VLDDVDVVVVEQSEQCENNKRRSERELKGGVVVLSLKYARQTPSLPRFPFFLSLHENLPLSSHRRHARLQEVVKQFHLRS